MTDDILLAAIIQDESVRSQLADVINEKDQQIKKLIEAKDKLIEAKDQQIKKVTEAQDKLINEKDKQILGLKGGLTCRGVLEYFANGYLKGAVIGKRKRLSVTDCLQESAKEAYSTNNATATNPEIMFLKDCYETCVTDSSKHNTAECSMFLTDLYAELSKDIHGAPWSGPSVKNTFSGSTIAEVKYTCFIEKICTDKLNLDLQS